MFNTQLLYLNVEVHATERRNVRLDQHDVAETALRTNRRLPQTQRMATNMLHYLGTVRIFLGDRLKQRSQTAAP